MRRIKVYSPGLLEMWHKDWIRDTNKFFRALEINDSHARKPFVKDGKIYELIGQVDDKELVCRRLNPEGSDDGTLWAMPRFDVQYAILGTKKDKDYKPSWEPKIKKK